MLVVGAVSIQLSRSGIESEARSYLIQALRDKTALLDSQLAQIEALAANISGVEEITNTLATTSSNTDIYSLLATQARIGYVLNNYLNLEGLVSIEIFTMSGLHFHVGETLNVGNLDTSLRDQLIRDSLVNPGSIYWAGIRPNVNSNSKYPNVLVATRMISRLDRETSRQEPVALLVINYDPDYIRKQFAGSAADTSSYMIMLDGQDRFAQHPDASQLGKKADPELLAKLSGNLPHRTSGMLVQSSPLRVPHWRLAILMPEDIIDRPARGIFQISALVMLASLLVVGVGAYLFMKGIVQPLRDITERFRTLRSMPETSQLPLMVKGDDDIANLGRGFNDLLEALNARRETEGALRLAASVFANSHEGILITDANNIIVDVNPGFTLITGYTKEESIGKNPSFISSGQQGADFYADMWASVQQNGHWRGDIWNRRKDGTVYAEILSISMIRDELGALQHYIGVFSDISLLKHHQTELEHIAHYDALTGLPNRSLLADRLHQAMVQAQRRQQHLVVAYLDLDGFKAINDNYGHALGDQLLIAVASRMKLVLREGDTLARIGGDEFVAVLLDLANIADSVPLLSRLLTAASQPVQIGDSSIQVSASIGVTDYPQAEGVDADQLLRQADQAMYQAKLAGKNRFHLFDAEQDRSVRGHHESLERIRQALIEQEFVLYYQPKVNLRTGAVIGAEALIRWQHPDKGLLLPAEFLPVIEEHPLAVEIGEWVINSALSQLAVWHAAGLDIPVSVNVSARQLQQADFVQRLRTLLSTHSDIRPCQLELEVLETSALEDLASASQVMVSCREIGVRFALDDFGTGYSSLTYLKRLPVTQLKIDQSFVHDMLDDPDDMAILEGVLGLASAFRLQVIAEGVETAAHGEMLLQLGCELAQGYGISRPMPADMLPDWALTWRPDPAWATLHAVSRDDLPTLFAQVEHRAWIDGIAGVLRGELLTPPPLDVQQCRFGLWLAAEGRARYAGHPAFSTIESLHRQVHALAATLCELQRQGMNVQAQARLDELLDLRDTMFVQLKLLGQRNRTGQ